MLSQKSDKSATTPAIADSQASQSSSKKRSARQAGLTDFFSKAAYTATNNKRMKLNGAANETLQTSSQKSKPTTSKKDSSLPSGPVKNFTDLTTPRNPDCPNKTNMQSLLDFKVPMESLTFA